MKQVDIAIIGAGSAGLSARSEVAKVTDSYVVIDPGPLGTTCARVGCMPSKALIEVANTFHRREAFSSFGITGSDHLAVNTRRVMSHVRALRDRFVGSVLDGMDEWQDKFIEGVAAFSGPRSIRVDGTEIGFKRAIIAAGSSPLVPADWSGYKDHLIDTDTIFELDDLPRRIAVVGLGPVGLELGQALARLGVEVTGIDPSSALGGLTSPPLQERAAALISKELALIFDMATPAGTTTAPPTGALRVEAGNHHATVDKVLLAIGRKATLESLELAAANIDLDDNGAPPFNPTTQRIDNTEVYIAGDVSGSRELLHEAVDEGRIAGYNAARGEASAFRRRPQLAITFCDPNIAIIGRSRKELEDAAADFAVGEIDFARQGRAIVKGEAKGACEVYLDRETGRILGAELLAPAGEHLAHSLAMAVSLNTSAEDLLATPYYHPVLEEGLRTALKRAASQLKRPTSSITLMRCDEPPVGGDTPPQ